MAYSFPSVHNFPPLFTLQPVADTRKEQIETWGDLLIGYHGAHKTYQQTVAEAAKGEVFRNKKINRSLTVDEITEVISALEEDGKARWMDTSKTKFAILWKTIGVWAVGCANNDVSIEN